MDFSSSLVTVQDPSDVISDAQASGGLEEKQARAADLEASVIIFMLCLVIIFCCRAVNTCFCFLTPGSVVFFPRVCVGPPPL